MLPFTTSISAREGPPRKRSQLASEKQEGKEREERRQGRRECSFLGLACRGWGWMLSSSFSFFFSFFFLLPMGGPLRRLCDLSLSSCPLLCSSFPPFGGRRGGRRGRGDGRGVDHFSAIRGASSSFSFFFFAPSICAFCMGLGV